MHKKNFIPKQQREESEKRTSALVVKSAEQKMSHITQWSAFWLAARGGKNVLYYRVSHQWTRWMIYNDSMQ